MKNLPGAGGLHQITAGEEFPGAQNTIRGGVFFPLGLGEPWRQIGNLFRLPLLEFSLPPACASLKDFERGFDRCLAILPRSPFADLEPVSAPMFRKAISCSFVYESFHIGFWKMEQLGQRKPTGLQVGGLEFIGCV
jgi:hypothetical protein